MHPTDLNLKKDFHDAYCNIKAPADLKMDTLKKMLEEDGHLEQRNTKAHNRKKNIGYFAAVAAVLCVAVLSAALLRPAKGDPAGLAYVTPMEEGVYYDEIELEDGMIRFVTARVAISITPSAGQVAIGQEEPAKNDLPNGDKTELMEQVETENGGILKFLKVDAAFLPEIEEENWSCIGGQKIYVSVQNTEETRYRAAYEKEGIFYEVTGTNVTQKELIDYLYLKIKK